MAGAKHKPGTDRPGSGGARAGAGGKPSEKTLFEREFVGPRPCKKERKRYESEEQREAAKKERERKKYEKRSAQLVAAREASARYACEALGMEYKKFARKTKSECKCAQCGVDFCSTLNTAKYCSSVCRNRASNTSERVEKMRKSDDMYKLKNRLRALVRSTFRRKGFQKGSKTEKILGCSWSDFRAHIERQFLPGMSWDRMGCEIHIDHIVPMAAAVSMDDAIRLSHFTNLRPLWSHENMSKGAKIEFLL